MKDKLNSGLVCYHLVLEPKTNNSFETNVIAVTSIPKVGEAPVNPERKRAWQEREQCCHFRRISHKMIYSSSYVVCFSKKISVQIMF